MTFLTPAWLIGLLPWAAVTAYLLWGRRKRQDVPFLKLWRGPVGGTKARRNVAAPPIAVAVALAAILMAVLAAGRPVVSLPAGGRDPPITVIVDRGVRMSALESGRPRFRVLGEALGVELASRFGPEAPVRLFTAPASDAAPEGHATQPTGLASLLDQIRPAALDSSDALRLLVRQKLGEAGGLVVVVSDTDLGIRHDRLLRVTPAAPPRNVGIAAFAVRESPRPQVMVRVRNDSGQTSAELRIHGVQPPVRERLDLPAPGGELAWFFDARAVAPVATARLEVADHLAADNQAWLVRRGRPAIEAPGPVGELRRLLDLYRALRPATGAAPAVRIVSAIRELGDGPGVVTHPTFAPGGATVRADRYAPHPVTGAVRDWATLDLPLGAAEAPPQGWSPLLWAGDRPLVAVRGEPARQAWVALDTNRWANTPQYVVFWTALLEWVGGAEGGDETFTADPLDDVSPEWKLVEEADGIGREMVPGPGVYARGDGARRAFNASPGRVDVGTITGVDWREELRAAAARISEAPGRRDAAAVLLLAALACVTAAAATWRR